MPKRTVVVIALSDPAGLLDGSPWQLDPEVRNAVEEAHVRIIRDSVKPAQESALMPLEIAPTPEESDPSRVLYLSEEAPHDLRYVVAPSEEIALVWSVRILTDAHKELSAAETASAEERGPRLQCGIAIVHEFPKSFVKRLFGREDDEPATATDDLNNKAREEVSRVLDLATGGRIVCSGDIHTALRKTDIYHYYGWQSAARRPVSHTSFWIRVIQSLRWAIRALSRRLRHGTPWECLYDDAQVLLNGPFERVFSAELREWVSPSRAARKITRPVAFPERPHIRNNLVGLALGGGGMRSGVFTVGVLQSLARHGFLADMDYMTSVSGGGYAGSALSALMAEELDYKGLRRLGTSKDTFPFTYPRSDGGDEHSSSQVHGNESPALKHVRENAALYGTKPGLFDAKTWIIAARYLTSTVALWAVFLIPIITAIAVLGLAVHTGMGQPGSMVADRFRNAMVASFVISGLLMLGYLLLPLFPRHPLMRFVEGLVRVAAYVLVTFSLLLAVSWIFGSVTTIRDADELWRDELILVGVLSPLAVFGFSAILSNLTDEPAPKRWQRALLPITLVAPFAAGLLALMLLVSGGVYVCDQLVNAEGWERFLRVAAAATAATGAFATVISLSKIWQMKQTQALAWRVVLAFGGYVVLGLAIIAWCWLLWYATDEGVSELRLVTGGIISVGIVAVTLFGHPAGRWVLNYASLHRIYAPMLARTWVIAARPKDHAAGARLPRWTRVWPRDDIQMRNLRENASSDKATGDTPDHPTGPYHLICTTLNLPGSTSTKLLDRKADSFVIAPLRSGSALTRWIKTEDHDELNKLRLSQAAAISGAAIAPNAGEHTSRTFSIIATLVNARLGRWIRNPRPSQNPTPVKWVTDSPLLLYWKEMFGLASHEDGQVYLSDGGHFENLGLYELFRRRCRYIIAVSADVGPVSKPFDLGNIGNALRLARVDFGVDVNLGEFKPLMHDLKTGYVKTYYAAGELTYPENAANSAIKGVLIFIKTGLCEDDITLDIAEHWLDGHPSFPYDSTLNQQYDQPTFESYRQLGWLAAGAMCRDAGITPAMSIKERFVAVRDAYEGFRRCSESSIFSGIGKTPGAVFEKEVVSMQTVRRVNLAESEAPGP